MTVIRINTAKPPRTREGLDYKLKHNAYPGGKKLRKARARLKARIDHYRDDGHCPGSMKA